MSKKLDDKDYREQLRDQIGFLQSSAKLYDMGTEAEAKRMAVSIRVLVYGEKESAQSQPLLGQMRLKKSMKFVSTAQPYDGRNLLAEQLLLEMRIDHNGMTYRPLFENGGRFHLLQYPDWAGEVVLTDKTHNVYRRKDLIKLLANKDGGAHVDANLPDSIAPLKSPDIGGWETQSSDGSRSYGNDPVYATMRQMTYEMLQSLYSVRPQLFSEQYF